jgi:phosphoribosylanthranilate isomerase
MNNTKIKICGITNIEDVLCAKNAGADFIGFVFYNKSPRYISPDKALEIKKQLGADIKTIGVFVNETKEAILEIKNKIGLDFVQIHGDETIDYCYDFDLDSLIKVLRVKDSNKEQLEEYLNSKLEYVLLDKYSEKQYGGTGELINLDNEIIDFAKNFKGKLFVSGGLNCENVCSIIETFNPFCVDVSSGVEIEPGKKDCNKIKEFIAIVKNL